MDAIAGPVAGRFWVDKVAQKTKSTGNHLDLMTQNALTIIFRTCKRLYNCHKCNFINSSGSCSPDATQYKVRGYESAPGVRVLSCGGKPKRIILFGKSSRG